MRKLLFMTLVVPAFALAQDKVRFDTVALVSDSVVQWKVLHDRPGVVYYLQQYKWNNWKDLDSIGSSVGSYALSVTRFIHHGENKFRIRAVAPGMLVYSKALRLSSEKPKGNSIPGSFSKKKTPVIELGRPEYYELYDGSGKLLAKGFGQQVSLTDLPEGDYYLNYAEISAMFRLSR